MSKNNETPDPPHLSFLQYDDGTEVEPTVREKFDEALSPLTNEVAAESNAETVLEEKAIEPDIYEEHKNIGPVEIVKHSGYIPTILSGVLGAGLSAAAALFALPADAASYAPAVAVLGFFLGAFAWIDARTHVIKNEHTILLGILSVPLTVAAALITNHPLMLALALGSALIIFILMIALVIITGFASGGDIKLSPIPAFVLGAISPLTACLWLFIAFFLTLVILVVNRVLVKERRLAAFGPAMVLAVPLSLIITVGLYGAAGMDFTALL